MGPLRYTEFLTLPGPKAMIFAHGFGCDQNMWRFVWPAFANEYRVVQFDHVGCGGSDLSAYDASRYASLDGYADDLREICHELDITHGVFVGHSGPVHLGLYAQRRRP
ncbi:alpha/beta fold hydrolase [Paracoccus zhejiangensis]|uniref:alpha/beta fold hydrolase n=1 Tax=Paracoccus zhejiangensis TaxID=1077935 RepID=UPI0018E3FE04|nr:alpha/beta hydrolase [Paracoccus zhejiangensis]